MDMTFEEFEAVPNRTLSESQERRLNHLHCSGDLGGGRFSTIQSLMDDGYLTQDGKLTEKAAHYIFHHGIVMSI